MEVLSLQDENVPGEVSVELTITQKELSPFVFLSVIVENLDFIC